MRSNLIEKGEEMKVPSNLIPLLYFVAVVGAACGMHFAGLPLEINTLICGAGLMRVKIPAPSKPPIEDALK